jgi:hypothetical protein
LRIVSGSGRRSSPQRVKVGDAVDAEHDGLTVDCELLFAILQRSLDDPGKALGPVVAVADEQLNGLAIALDAEAVAVIFDFVDPVGAGSDRFGGGRQAEFERGNDD